MLTNFFFTLTKKNWGWPYHLIIAQNSVLGLIKAGVSWHLSAILIFFFGIGYGYYQLRAGKDTVKGAGQDFIAEFIGIMLGLTFGYWL